MTTGITFLRFIEKTQKLNNIKKVVQTHLKGSNYYLN